MQVKKWILSAAVIALLAACNNKGSGDEYKDTSGTTNTSTTEYQQTTRTVEAPPATRTSFETKYPKATSVTWTYYEPAVTPIDWEWSGWTVMDTSDYTASFTMDGSDYWVWYDESGDWVGTVSTVTDHSSLPAAVNNTIKAQFAGYTIVSVDKENDKNRTAYEIELDKAGDKMKVLIDENGNVLKKKGGTGDDKMKEKM